jgi:antitoxin MazE
MSDRKRVNRVAKWGNSLALRIPREAAERLRLTEGTEVHLQIRGQSMTIQRAHRISTLDDLLKGVTPENSGGEIDFGPAVGREAW